MISKYHNCALYVVVHVSIRFSSFTPIIQQVHCIYNMYITFIQELECEKMQIIFLSLVTLRHKLMSWQFGGGGGVSIFFLLA